MSANESDRSTAGLQGSPFNRAIAPRRVRSSLTSVSRSIHSPLPVVEEALGFQLIARERPRRLYLHRDAHQDPLVQELFGLQLERPVPVSREETGDGASLAFFSIREDKASI